jgi:signal transduction histidine kinase
MRWPLGRVGTAGVLTAAAVVVPCAAWFVAGSHAASHEAQRIAAEPRAWAQKVAEAMAERMGARLETIRETESRRPFYHYRPLFHDPTSTCECASVTPSPLAAGPVDPLIWTHFEVDAKGALTLPSAHLAVYDDACRSWVDDPSEILAQLRPIAATLSSAAAQAARNLDSRGYVEAPWTENGASDVAWVGPLTWHTITVAGEPTLVAVREVRTPPGDLVQGLVIARTSVADAVRGAALPARFVHGDQPLASEAAVEIAGLDWQILADAAAEIAQATQRARQVQARFLHLFVGAASTAALAGLFVVGLVWKTERLARQRSQFAASAAHELRTPLAGLRLYSEMLAEGMGDGQKSREYARRVAEEAERLGRVVTNVLGYTRLERGSLGVRPQQGDLAAAVGDSVRRMQPALEAAGARLRVQLADALPPVAFDVDALFHIVQNLVDNAEKFTRGAVDRSIDVALTHDGASVRLSVRDHGPGVPAALRHRLFQPFARTEDPDAPPGLGLGLTLVQRLSRAQNASVSCENAPGGGALFVVTFPV